MCSVATDATHVFLFFLKNNDVWGIINMLICPEIHIQISTFRLLPPCWKRVSSLKFEKLFFNNFWRNGVDIQNVAYTISMNASSRQSIKIMNNSTIHIFMGVRSLQGNGTHIYFRLLLWIPDRRTRMEEAYWSLKRAQIHVTYFN